MAPPDSDNTRPINSTDAKLAGAEFARDEIVGGRYKVLSILGKGGMGLVYRVEQIFLGKELALKTIHKSFLSDITVKRFEHEARAAFAVNHPNIIAVNAYGLLDDQTPFLAMEIVDGETLAELLHDSGPLPMAAALPIIIQVCFGLAHAHNSGVVHRDIKPSNIMILKGRELGTEGSVKILDFGIAKFSHRDGGEIQALTKTGEIFG
ncbi:MAG: serine/threonine protein kinase, partial [Cyanobacteria bacterium PR.023]|nr:serine/threonine protein kinase [Cyanobacteria bacterium PR.023]